MAQHWVRSIWPVAMTAWKPGWAAPFTLKPWSWPGWKTSPRGSAPADWRGFPWSSSWTGSPTACCARTPTFTGTSASPRSGRRCRQYARGVSTACRNRLSAGWMDHRASIVCWAWNGWQRSTRNMPAPCRSGGGSSSRCSTACSCTRRNCSGCWPGIRGARMADKSGLHRPLPSNRLEEAISQPGCRPRREILPTSRRAPGLAWTLLVVALLASLLIALLAGKYPLRLADLLDSLASHLGGTSEPPAQQIETVLWQLRLPRILTALLVGGALAAAGAAYQGMF